MRTPFRLSISILLLFAVLAAGCGGKASNECDEFLEGYEKYVMDYIDFAKKAQENPTDMSLMQKATTMAAEAAQWSDKAPSCQDDPDFVKKYSELQAKLTQAYMDM